MSFKPRGTPPVGQAVVDEHGIADPSWYQWFQRLPKHDVNGAHEIQAINIGVASVSAAYTADNERLILVDATDAETTVTLPAVSGMAGRMYSVVKTDGGANAVNVAAAAGETINGAASTALAAQYNKVTVVTDGTEWFEL